MVKGSSEYKGGGNMKLPRLNEYSQSKDVTETFLGLNRNLRTSPGEWSDMKNMTTDNYPVASTRDKRSIQTKVLSAIDTMYLCGIDFVNGELVSFWVPENLDDKCALIRNGYSNTTGMDITVIDGRYYISSATVIEYDEGNDTTLIQFRTDKQIKESEQLLNQSFVFCFCNETENGRTMTKSVFGKIVEIVGRDIFISVAGHNSFVSIPNVVYISGGSSLKNAFFSSCFETNKKNRQLVRNGANICVFPDGVVYTTNDNGVTDSLYGIKRYSVSEDICVVTVAETTTLFGYSALGDIKRGKYRIMNNAVQKYLEDSKLWVDETTYMMFIETNTEKQSAFESFNVGDVVTFNYLGNEKNVSYVGTIMNWNKSNESYEKRDLKIIHKGVIKKGDTIETLDGSNGMTFPSETTYIIVEGYVYNSEKEWALTDDLIMSFECRMPNVSYACESQNRIWACSVDGHEIYASALGNPYNWYDYSGLSTDSYAVNVGTDGVFTGCCNYLGYPLFFKENALHMISGNYPEQYVVTTLTDFKGVEKGSDKSFGIIDNILYYKSACGIVAFDGATTTVISEALGNEHYKNAVAGVYKNKYYVSMQDSKDEHHLFVYDTKKGFWCHEDNIQVVDFITVGNELLYVSNDGVVKSVEKENLLNVTDSYVVEEDFEWYAETGTFGYSYPNNKYLSRFQIRMKLAQGARASFYIQYNSDGVWHRKGEMCGQGVKSFLVPIVPMRCDHMKIKIEGKGEAKIYSISKVFEEGGDQ